MAAIDPKYVAGFYNDLAKMGAGRMAGQDTVYVEGADDADFFSKVMGDKYRWSGLFGKENVIETWVKHINGQLQTNCKNSFFCIDRDYDEILKLDLKKDTEKSLYYQMCHEGRVGGYNDLECFLFASPIFDYALRCEFSLQLEEIAKFREEIIKFASWIGSYRVANRMWQAQTGASVFCCNLKPNDTIVDPKEYGNHEANPAFLFQEKFAKIKKDSITVNWEKFEKKMKSLVKSAYGYDFVLENAHKIQEQMAGMKAESLIDYCRGHDITYLLCILLRNHSEQFSRLNRHDVERALEKWPLPSESVVDKSKKFMEQFQMIRELGE